VTSEKTLKEVVVPITGYGFYLLETGYVFIDSSVHIDCVVSAN
jgi:hypothetical protein